MSEPFINWLASRRVRGVPIGIDKATAIVKSDALSGCLLCSGKPAVLGVFEPRGGCGGARLFLYALCAGHSSVIDTAAIERAIFARLETGASA